MSGVLSFWIASSVIFANASRFGYHPENLRFVLQCKYIRSIRPFKKVTKGLSPSTMQASGAKEDFRARSGYLGHPWTITFHGICGMSLLEPTLNFCFWHTRPHMWYDIREFGTFTPLFTTFPAWSLAWDVITNSCPKYPSLAQSPQM